MRYFISTLILTFSINSFANNSIELVKITNDTDSLIAFMNVLTDTNNEITGYEYSKYRDNVLIETKSFPAILDYTGFVLEQVRSKDVVILRGVNVSEVNGGTLEIDFLFNAISGARGQFVVELSRTDDSWQLTQDNVILSHIHLVANKRPGIGIVGIKQILIKE